MDTNYERTKRGANPEWIIINELADILRKGRQYGSFSQCDKWTVKDFSQDHRLVRYELRKEEFHSLLDTREKQVQHSYQRWREYREIQGVPQLQARAQSV